MHCSLFSGTHQFDLVWPFSYLRPFGYFDPPTLLRPKPYFDFLAKLYINQNCTSTCTSRPIASPDLTKGRCKRVKVKSSKYESRRREVELQKRSKIWKWPEKVELMRTLIFTWYFRMIALIVFAVIGLTMLYILREKICRKIQGTADPETIAKSTMLLHADAKFGTDKYARSARHYWQSLFDKVSIIKIFWLTVYRKSHLGVNQGKICPAIFRIIAKRIDFPVFFDFLFQKRVLPRVWKFMVIRTYKSRAIRIFGMVKTDLQNMIFGFSLRTSKKFLTEFWTDV